MVNPKIPKNSNKNPTLSPEEDEDKALGEGFLEAKEAETLLEEA